MSEQVNNRVARNTFILYIRQAVILLLGLYTVRVLLAELGASDYGTYHAVAGLVLIFSFLSGTLAAATQRFFSYALGKDSQDQLLKVFNSTLVIYVLIAVLAVGILETLGLWFVEYHLKVPPDRFEAAKTVYHFSVAMFVCTVVMTPFMSILIAHEDMNMFALISIFEAVLKLIVVFIVECIAVDKLAAYGGLLFLVSFLVAVSYLSVCFKRYSECRINLGYFNKGLFKEICGFTGWTLFGQISTVFRFQAVTLLLNQMFNPIVVAAQSIASNVANQISIFSSNFNMALYPSIIKYYANGKPAEMLRMVFSGSKVTFSLMWIFSLPILIEMEFVLSLWLEEIPDYAFLFTRLAVIEVLINSISLPIATAARAPGKMRCYELSLGTIQIAIFILGWVSFSLGAPAYSILLIAIFANILMLYVRLKIVSGLIGLCMHSFWRDVLKPSLWLVLLTTAPMVLMKALIPTGVVASLVVIISALALAGCAIYKFTLDELFKEVIRSSTQRIYSLIFGKSV